MADGATLANEVESFYCAFLDGFNREDTDMYLRSFCYPNGILSGERGLTVNAKESDQQRFYQEVMSSIQERGWDHTSVTQLHVWPITAIMAFLVADISRYKKDNSILESGRYCYTVRKDKGMWKVVTLTEIRPPFTGPSASQDSTAEGKTIIGEVEGFYRDYIAGFNREDRASFIRSYGHPHAFLIDEKGMVVTLTVTDHENFYQQIMTDLHKREWGRSVTDLLQVWPLTTATALIVADITRYKKDNTVLEKGRYSYTLQKDNDAWKILTATEIKPPFSGPGERRP